MITLNSKLQSDFMDIFLLSNCEFYFGSPSGYSKHFIVIQKASVVINMIPIEAIFSYKDESLVFL